MKATQKNSNIKNTSSVVCDALRKMILCQQLKPGERLVESKIADTLNVSITPVRQAFSMLNTQGLITVFPYRGSFVTIISHEFALDLIEARRVIEPAVAEMAFPNIVKEDSAYLQKLCEMSDIMFGMGDLLSSVEYDVMFHDFFFQKSNNTALYEIWEFIKCKVVLLQCLTKQDCSSDEKLLVTRHHEIIRAVATSDCELLKRSIYTHLGYTINKLNLPFAKDIVYV